MKLSLTGSLSVLLLALAIFTGTLTAQTQPSAGNAPKGSVERIKVHGTSLEGNLEGDSPDRDVVVVLYVTDMKATAAAVKAAGVTVDGEPRAFGAAGMLVGFAVDPAGNRLVRLRI